MSSRICVASRDMGFQYIPGQISFEICVEYTEYLLSE